MAIAAMVAWVLTASIGVYMLRTWLVRGGLRRQRATGAGVPPAVVFGHAGIALTGLLTWLAFIRTGWAALGWLGVALIVGAVALGISTVTLWTPYPVAVPPAAAPAPVPPAPAPADALTVTDEMIADLLADPAPASRRPRLKLAGLIPVAHGFAALTTFMLAVLAAVSARLGSSSARRAVWDHGRNADNDGCPRASRRRGVEHRRGAGGLLRPGHPHPGRDMHQRRVRGRARRGQAPAERPRRARGGPAAPG